MRKSVIILLLLMSVVNALAQEKVLLPAINWLNPESIKTNTAEKKLNVAVCIRNADKTGVKLYLNNILVRGSKNIGIDTSSSKPVNCRANFIQALTLTPGINIVRIEASNKFGTVKNTREIKYSQAKVIEPIEQIPEKRKALVIGNGNYGSKEGSQVSLFNCYNDADTMAGMLRSLSFEITEIKDATMQSLKNAVDTFCRDLSNYDVALLYFSGHGLESQHLNCLFPVDARISDVKELMEKYSISTDPGYGLSGRIISGGARNTIFIVDACRDDPWVKKMEDESKGIHLDKQVRINEEERTDSVTVATGYHPTNNNGYLVAYATGAGRTATSGSAMSKKNSPYTIALLKHMIKPGAPVTEVLTKAQVTLRKMAEQDCTFYYGLTKEFCFRPYDFSMDSISKNLAANNHKKGEAGYDGIIRDCRIDTAAMEDSVPGLRFHLDFEVAHMAGSKGEVFIDLYDDNGIPIRDVDDDREPHWTSGTILFQSEFASGTGIYNNENFSNNLFAAYSNFDPKLKGKTIKYRVAICTGTRNIIRLISRLRPLQLPQWR